MHLKFDSCENWKLGLASYFLIIYAPGCFFWLAFPDVFSDYYNKGQVPPWATLPFIFICILVLCLTANLKLWDLKVKKIKLKFVLFCFLVLCVSAFFMLLSLKLGGQVSHSFRHQGRLSDYGGVGYLYYVLKTLCELLFLRLIFTKSYFEIKYLPRYLLFLSSLFFIYGSIVFSIGSFQFISMIFALLIAFKSFNIDLNYHLSKINLSSVTPLAITALGTVLFGVGVKVGFDSYFTPEGREIIYSYLSRVFARLSTSLYSAHFALGDISANSIELVDASLNIARQRFETLFLGTGAEELLMNINSYNYLSAFQSQGGGRGGASPGPVGTIFYLFPTPLGFIIIVSLLLVVRKSLSAMFPQRRSWIHIFITIYILTRVLESPLLFLQVLDLSFIFFVLFVIIFMFMKISRVDT